MKGPLIKWSCNFKWEIKPIISPPRQCLLTPNFVIWWFTVRGSHAWSYMTLWSSDQRDITQPFKFATSQPSQDLWSINLAGCWIWKKVSARKRLNCHWLLVLCSSLFLSLANLDGLTKFVCVYSFYYSFRWVWSISD